MSNPNALAEFNAATKALVVAAQAVASHGVASDVAEAKKSLDTAHQNAQTALKVQTTKKA